MMRRLELKIGCFSLVDGINQKTQIFVFCFVIVATLAVLVWREATTHFNPRSDRSRKERNGTSVLNMRETFRLYS